LNRFIIGLKENIMAKLNIVLGEPIRFDQVLVRKESNERLRSENHNSYLKYWENKALGKQEHGIVVGVRTLSNGIKTYCEALLYKPKYYFKALLVITDLRKKPVFVPIDQLKKD
jgi:hypothetical protein